MTVWIVVSAIVAGALGALLRYAVTRAVRAPRGVLIVNVAGSLVAGVMLAVPGDLQYVLVAGFAGGLTTFSTWTVETVQLAIDGKLLAAAGNVLLNLAAGIAAAVIGYLIASAL